MTLRDQLLELQEPKYMKFTAALMPGVENVLGIRLPVLRKIARQIAAGDWRTYLAEAEDFYFEERMLQGLVIGCARCTPAEKLDNQKTTSKIHSQNHFWDARLLQIGCP